MSAYRLTVTGQIVRTDDGAFIPSSESNTDYRQYLAWLAGGNSPDQDSPQPEQLEVAVVEAVQKRLDDFARTRIYDDIKSAASYADDEDPQFALEGGYCKAVRSRSWRTCYAIMADVQAGRRPMPTVDEVLAEMPELAWPV